MSSEKILKTIKGKIENLIININKLTADDNVSFVQTFKINGIKIKISSKKSINAREGDFVIVAGEEGINKIFEAFSFKNLN